jgi:hypothetical protein
MFPGLRILFLFFFLGWHSSRDFLLTGNPTKAFQDYFSGVSYFKEGQITLADQHFKSAFAHIPTNFTFCLSYALTQGRLNKFREANELLGLSNKLIKGTDAEIQEKRALHLFFKGMIFLYHSKFDEARVFLNESKKIFESREENAIVSILYNAIGFSIFAHQGINVDRTNIKKLHAHIYPISLFRSAVYFQKSLYADPTNLYAQHNFNLLNDTLCLDFSAPVVKNPKFTPGQIPADWQDKLLGSLQISPNDEIVFLIDISGSMVTEKVSCTGMDRFRTTQWLTNCILDKIISDNQVGIGTIGGDCKTPPAAWKKVGNTSISDIKSTISRILPEGSTPLARMLVHSSELFSNNSKVAKSLIVISDGANTCPHPEQAICTSAKILAGKKIKVHVLSFLQNNLNHAAAFADYECLTETTSGKLLYLEDNQCQMRTISYDLVQACGVTLPPFEKSNCLGPSIPHLWMFYKSDLFIVNKKNQKE